MVDTDRTTFLAFAAEQCPICLQDYVLEMELRCSVCDGPLCPLCVVTVLTDSFCPACQEENDASTCDVDR